MIHGILWVLQVTFVKACLFEKDHPQLFSKNSPNLASSSCGLGWEKVVTRNVMEHGRGTRRQPQSSSFPTTRFNQGIATPNPLSLTGGIYAPSGMMDYPRLPISEMHFGKFPDSKLESQFGN